VKIGASRFLDSSGMHRVAQSHTSFQAQFGKGAGVQQGAAVIQDFFFRLDQSGVE